MNLSAINLAEFFGWWRDNLLASLPGRLRNRLQDFNARYDYLVLRQGDEAIVLDDKGELVESLPLSAAQAQSGSSPGGTVVSLANPVMSNAADETVTAHVEDGTARVVDLTLIREGDVSEMTAMTRARLAQYADEEEETLLFYFDGGELKAADAEPAGEAVDVLLSADSPEQADASLLSPAEKALLERYLAKGRCLFVLPAECMLSLSLDYPLEAESSLDTALRYDLEKHIPMSSAEIVHFHAIGQRGSERLRVFVEVMKKRLFQRLQQELAPLLERGLACTTPAFRQIGPSILPMREGKGGSLIASAFHRRHLLLWVNLALLVLLLAFPHVYIKNRYAHFEPVSDQELSRAKSIQAMKRQMETEAGVRARVIERLQQQPRVIELLDRLSKRLDKQAWLTDFLLEKDHLRIRGEADSATRVTDDLNAAGLFDDIRFVSSIVKSASSGKETFEITMKIK